MAVTADILRRLGKLRLDPEALEEVLAIIADIQSVDEDRKAKQRERTAKHRALRRDGNVTVTAQIRDGDVTGALPNDPAPLPPHTPPITPTPNTPSDPGGSGSPSAEPTAPAEIDPRKDLFDRGVPALRRMTGRADPGCRALLGKWLGLAQDSAVIVMTAVDAAVEGELASPIPWIEKTIRNEVQRNGSGSHDLFNGRAPSSGRGGSSFDAVAAGLARVADRRGLRPGGRQNGSGQDDPRDHRARPDDPEIEDAHWSPAGGHRAAHH